MKSNANIKGHPIHPMIIVFPIAFFIGTFIFDILGIVTDYSVYYAVSYYMQLSGVIGALLAAIPGAIDYFKTVPPTARVKTSDATCIAQHNKSCFIFYSMAVKGK